jgi:hypothetical protein
MPQSRPDQFRAEPVDRSFFGDHSTGYEKHTQARESLQAPRVGGFGKGKDIKPDRVNFSA